MPPVHIGIKCHGSPSDSGKNAVRERGILTLLPGLANFVPFLSIFMCIMTVLKSIMTQFANRGIMDFDY